MYPRPLYMYPTALYTNTSVYISTHTFLTPLTIPLLLSANIYHVRSQCEVTVT